MPISLICPLCKVQFNAPDGTEGFTINCPHCQGKLTIPGQTQKPSALAVKFWCPSCNAENQGEPDEKIFCQQCGQKLKVPKRENKTILGSSVPPTPPTPPPLPAAPITPQAPPVRQEPAYVHPDDDDDDWRDRRPRRSAFRCPYCGSTAMPRRKSEIAPAGWAILIIMLFVCFPLFFLGFFITEEYRRCADCGVRLG